MNILKQFWSWLCALVSLKRPPLRTSVVEDLPGRLNPKSVYLVGENEHFWCVALLCPCGCREVIQLNLVTNTRPLWTFELHKNTNTLTLRPSVCRTSGCRSHFFLRGGRVDWCTTGLLCV